MKTKQFLQLSDKLDEALEESVDIFLAQRPFIADKTIDPIILERSDAEIERKIDNDVLIERIMVLCSR